MNQNIYNGIIVLYNKLIAVSNINARNGKENYAKNDHEGEEQRSDIEPRKASWNNKKRFILTSTLVSFVILWWRKRLKRRPIKPRVYHRELSDTSTKRASFKTAVETPLSLLLVAAKKGLITKAMIDNNIIAYQLREKSSLPNEWKKALLPKDNPGILKEIMNDLAESGCLDVSVLPESLLSRMGPLLITAFPFIYLFLLYHMMKRLQNGQNNSDNAGVYFQNEDFERITFADVAGIDTAQIELQEIVSYLSNPGPFLGLGALPPTGLLLHGSPGLGKTLLARAVAGEARADCFMSCTGSDFVEIYVGQGAKRVRQIFSDLRLQALKNWKKNRNNNRLQNFFNKVFNQETLSLKEKSSLIRRPTAVLFIDEIDSLAKCRDGIGRGALFSGGGGGNDEREHCVNALLSEMDGFNKSEVVTIIIAATNRKSVLDPALMRPGRFDRHIALTPPDASGREAILEVHSRQKKLDKEVNLREIADDKWTASYTGAELRNVINEAALLAVRDGSQAICQKHIHQSIQRIKLMRSQV